MRCGCVHTQQRVCVCTRAPHAFVDTRALQRVCMQKYNARLVANEQQIGQLSAALTHSPGYNGQQRTALRQSACGGEDPRCSRRPPLLLSVGICARNFRLIATARREKIAYLCLVFLYCHVLRVAVSAIAKWLRIIDGNWRIVL